MSDEEVYDVPPSPDIFIPDVVIPDSDSEVEEVLEPGSLLRVRRRIYGPAMERVVQRRETAWRRAFGVNTVDIGSFYRIRRLQAGREARDLLREMNQRRDRIDRQRRRRLVTA